MTNEDTIKWPPSWRYYIPMERYSGIVNGKISQWSDIRDGNEEMLEFDAIFDEGTLIWDAQQKEFIEWIKTEVGYGKIIVGVTGEKLKKTLTAISRYIGLLDPDSFADFSEFADGEVQYINAVLNYSLSNNPSQNYINAIWRDRSQDEEINKLKKDIIRTISDKVNEGNFSEREKERILDRYQIKKTHYDRYQMEDPYYVGIRNRKICGCPSLSYGGSFGGTVGAFDNESVIFYVDPKKDFQKDGFFERIGLSASNKFSQVNLENLRYSLESISENIRSLTLTEFMEWPEKYSRFVREILRYPSKNQDVIELKEKIKDTIFNKVNVDELPGWKGDVVLARYGITGYCLEYTRNHKARQEQAQQNTR